MALLGFYRYYIFLVFISGNVFMNFAEDGAFDTAIYKAPVFPERGYVIYRTNPQGAFKYFQDGAGYFLEKGDTSNYIICLIGISDLEKRNGHYNRSFDILSDVLKNYIQLDDYTGLTDLHLRLGRLYGIFGQDSLALYHQKKSLEISKQHPYYKSGSTTYFAVAEQYSRMENYDTAIAYLDSCYLVTEKNTRRIYVDALYGYSYMKKGDYRKSEIYFRGLIPLFEKGNIAYLAKVYAFHGELKSKLNQADSAIYYYEKALETINTLKVHYEIKPDVLEELAHLYYEQGEKEKGFEYMVIQKEVSDSLFNLQSEQNKELFEVKTEFLEDLTKKEEQIVAQKRLIVLTKQASFRLKLIFGVMLLLLAIGLITFRQRFQLRKLAFEKRKNDDIIEVKNKELTAHALQFIEKEHAFTELLDFVKENAPGKYKSFNYKSRQSNKRIWDDFHLRFTKTNATFYEKLRQLHPDLTQTDLKHCALVKLNFDSKEMAIILGISLHGVHTARSRIRKKIGLNREDSLSGYLAGIN